MKNSIAIIGAGPGISQGVALHFGKAGYEVVLLARQADKLTDLVQELQQAGVSARSLVVDISQLDQLHDAIASLDGLQVLHYNAAAVHETSVLEETVASLTKDFTVNVGGLLTAVQAALPQLEAQQGSVLVTGGGLAKSPHPLYASLALGKAAQANLANSLSQVLQPKGVYVGVLQVNAFVSPTDPVHNPTNIAQHFWAMHTDRTQLENEL